MIIDDKINSADKETIQARREAIDKLIRAMQRLNEMKERGQNKDEQNFVKVRNILEESSTLEEFASKVEETGVYLDMWKRMAWDYGVKRKDVTKLFGDRESNIEDLVSDIIEDDKELEELLRGEKRNIMGAYFALFGGTLNEIPDEFLFDSVFIKEFINGHSLAYNNFHAGASPYIQTKITQLGEHLKLKFKQRIVGDKSSEQKTNGDRGEKNMSVINLREKETRLERMFRELGIFDLGDQIKFMEYMQEKNPQELANLLSEFKNEESQITDGLEVGE